MAYVERRPAPALDSGEKVCGRPWRIFWVAFLLRVAVITLAHTYHVRPAGDHFQFGWEPGRIARALATGYGYADPFTGHTGPTTWIPPLFPSLLAGVFQVFGVYSAASAWVILTVNSLFSAGTVLAIYEIGWRCFDATGEGRRVGVWSAWIWALHPAAMQYAVHWILEMSIATFLLTWVFVYALEIRGVGDSVLGPDGDRHRVRPWLMWGLLWGLIALTNPSLLLFLPVCGLWMMWGMVWGGPGAELLRAVRGLALGGGVVVLCLLPWIVRNERVFGAFIPTRGNLGAELYQSTLAENAGFPWGTTVPLVERDPEYQRYKQMGELRYVREQGARAKVVIRAHPGQIARWTAQRVFFFWAGVPHPFEKSVALEIGREMNYAFVSLAGLLGLFLALRRRVPGAMLFALAFGTIPLIYYLITVQARFRHPIEPLMTILAVYLFQSADRTRAWSGFRL